MAQEWYVETPRGVDGPLSAQELAAWASDGRLKPSDRVSPDRQRWADANRVKGLQFPDMLRTTAGESIQPDSSPTETSEFATAKVTPGYDLVSFLGSGACGVVYKARQIKLDRIVALKMVKLTDNTPPSMSARFEKEAVSLAKLQHPNIVNVFDAGRHGQQVYFAMELLDGEDLARRIFKSGPIDERTAWAIARQTAAALAHAAGHGIYHRDIKPANLFLVPMPTGYGLPPDLPLVKVMDFGLALTQRPEQDTSGADRLTQAGTVVGTPAYMAPEQFKTPDIDHRADIYSLGATVLHALTGRPPFDAATVWDVMLQKAEGTVPRPGPPVTPASADLIEAMLAAKADQRVGSYEDLIQRIDCLPAMTGLANPDGSSILAIPTVPTRARRQTGRRWMVGAVTAAGVVLLATAVGIGWLAFRDSPTPGTPSKPAVEYVREGHTEYLFNTTSQVGWIGLQGEVLIVEDDEQAKVLEIEQGVYRTFPPIADYRLTLGLDLYQSEWAVLMVGPSGAKEDAPRVAIRVSRDGGAAFGTVTNGAFTPIGPPVPYPSADLLQDKRPYREIRFQHTGSFWTAWFDRDLVGQTEKLGMVQASELRILTDGHPVRLEAPVLEALKPQPIAP